jgi:hypothetical protein
MRSTFLGCFFLPPDAEEGESDRSIELFSLSGRDVEVFGRNICG